MPEFESHDDFMRRELKLNTPWKEFDLLSVLTDNPDDQSSSTLGIICPICGYDYQHLAHSDTSSIGKTLTWRFFITGECNHDWYLAISSHKGRLSVAAPRHHPDLFWPSEINTATVSGFVECDMRGNYIKPCDAPGIESYIMEKLFPSFAVVRLWWGDEEHFFRHKRR